MQAINLLPPELRTGLGVRRSLIYPMLFLIVFSALTGVFLRMNGELNRQAKRKEELATAIAALEPVRVQRELLIRLEAELNGVKNELGRRIKWSEYTDELATRLPYGVVVRDLRLDEQRIVISASADNMAQVAQFITNLAASALYKEPQVGQMSITPNRVDFQATIDIVRAQRGGAAQ